MNATSANGDEGKGKAFILLFCRARFDDSRTFHRPRADVLLVLTHK